MPKTDDELAQDFLNSLKKWNIKISYDEKLCVILFHGLNEKVRNSAREFFADNPHIERALLARINLGMQNFDEDDIPMRRICYGLAKLWECPLESLDRSDQAVRKHWEAIMSWLATYGGEVSNLPGALRYVFSDEPRDDGEKRFPSSFPVLAIEDVVTYGPTARERAEQRALQRRKTTS